MLALALVLIFGVVVTHPHAVPPPAVPAVVTSQHMQVAEAPAVVAKDTSTATEQLEPPAIVAQPDVVVTPLPDEEPAPVAKVVKHRAKVVLGSASTDSPQGKKKVIHIAHFKNAEEAVSGKAGTNVEVIEQGRMNPDKLTSPGPDVPYACRSDIYGHPYSSLCVPEKFVASKLGASTATITVADFPSFFTAVSGAPALTYREIPINQFNPRGRTSSDAHVPATCVYVKGRPIDTCVATEFIEMVDT